MKTNLSNAESIPDAVSGIEGEPALSNQGVLVHLELVHCVVDGLDLLYLDHPRPGFLIKLECIS